MISTKTSTSATRTTSGGGSSPASSATSEYYDTLLGRIEGSELSSGGRPKVLGLAGCKPQDGVTTVAANLAIHAARSGYERVLLVDAHLRRPKVHQIFRADETPGMAQALAGDQPATEFVQRSPVEKLWLLTAGTNRGRAVPSRLPKYFREVFDDLSCSFEFIVVDLPPAVDLSNSFTIAGMLDGLLLVAASGRHRADALQRVKKRFLQSNANLLGLVLSRYRT